MPLLPWLWSALVGAVTYSLRYIGASIFAARSIVVAWILFNLPYIVKKLLISLGLGYITYELGDFGLDFIYSLVEDRLSELPEIGLKFLRMSGALEAISILFGALSARISYSALSKERKTMAFLA
ncbi:MAG: DUF2523 domain-containing protein [Epsilonproteobacteria bacterium]|nr:DUF2523 domain-containing protein [Campylobacterota bacterium]